MQTPSASYLTKLEKYKLGATAGKPGYEGIYTVYAIPIPFNSSLAVNFSTWNKAYAIFCSTHVCTSQRVIFADATTPHS